MLYSIEYLRQKFELQAMALLKKDIGIVQFPSESELVRMSNYELFEVANRSLKFRKELLKFISSQKVKPTVPIIEKYDVRELGLTERLKNGLLRGNFRYLTDLTSAKKYDLMRISGFGKKSYNELLEVMDKYGFQLDD
jgi:DNA-directed RNA polymerase alpha subunit